ncbi:acetyl-CoA acetyltransferase [Actinospongicola halichondriae]|uniref:acetyl-CoA acetyltransferase n=1 Tax=Actinospongicola halichondriae TaxID=3236844 RepID=UPI003D42230D
MSDHGLDPRAPVLVGVGSCHDDVEAVELMVRASLAAGTDATPALLSQVERISVTHGTWSYADPARIIADRIGAPDATTVLVDVGIPQQTVIDETLASLLAGEVEVALVVGGEAKARDARLRAQSTQADAAGIASVFRGESGGAETDQGDVSPDVHQHPVGDLVDPAELDAGLWAPVDQYALIENALAAAEGVDPQQLCRDLGALYGRFNEVARTNPEAAFPAPMSADDIATFSPRNRPLAFPYAKWHVTQWTVDQGAALLLCTVGAAERAGVPRDRWVFPVVGLGSSHMVPLTQRGDLHRWPAMAVLGEAAEQRLGHPLSDCDLVELYSCFPVAVRVQQRELGLPLAGTPTVTGGMAFAGGPFNSFVFQALVTVVRRLREVGGRALVTSVSGLLTKPGLGVWSTSSDGQPPLIADLADDVRASTPVVPVVRDAVGTGTVASWTVTHEGQEPTALVVIVDLDDGGRAIARSDDRKRIDRALQRGACGDPVSVDRGRIVD